MTTYQTAHIILFDEQNSVNDNLRKGDVIQTDQMNIELITSILDARKINYSAKRTEDEVADIDDQVITIL